MREKQNFSRWNLFLSGLNNLNFGCAENESNSDKEKGMSFTMKALTNSQKLFAEEHHDLIGSFLKSRHLSYDEYYDTVIFGYLNAVKKYTDREELQQYSFKNIAYRSMSCSLGNHFRGLNTQKNKATVLSLNAESANGLTLEEMVASSACTEQEVIFMAERNSLLGCFDDEDRRILSLMMDGFCEKEIAKNIGISAKIIPIRVTEIRDKAQQWANLQAA